MRSVKTDAPPLPHASGRVGGQSPAQSTWMDEQRTRPPMPAQLLHLGGCDIAGAEAARYRYRRRGIVQTTRPRHDRFAPEAFIRASPVLATASVVAVG